MEYFTYKITLEGSDKFYVGSHKTKFKDPEQDSYMGSGLWVSQIKDKSKLKRQILEFFDDELSAIKAEQLLLLLLDINFDLPNNMNMTNKAIGFASGQNNPSCRPEAKKYLGNNYTEYQRSKMVEFNKKEETIKKRKERNKFLAKNGLHNFQNPELRKKINKISKKRWIEDNPMWKPEIIAKFKGLKKELSVLIVERLG